MLPKLQYMFGICLDVWQVLLLKQIEQINKLQNKYTIAIKMQ